MDKTVEENLDFFKGKGLTGLQNLGNTCFMNSAIHCISNTLPLTSYFLIQKKYQTDMNQNKKQSKIVYEWYRLLEGIWDSNCTIAPSSFHRNIKLLAEELNRDDFRGYNQNDIQEFIEFFIDNLHEGICKEVEINITGEPVNQVDHMALQAMTQWKNFFKNNYSICVDLFYGQFVSKILSLEDNTDYSHSYEPFCYLTLPIPNNENVNIYDCLKHFCKTEVLDDDCKWKSEKHNKEVKAVRQMMFWSTPKILIIVFKRYGNRGGKRNCKIDFPLENLNLENYCVGYDKFNSKYSLYGICNHGGGTGFGHYWAYCKNENGYWHKYDDEDVTTIDKNNIVTSNAYCLFYKKIS